MITALLALLFQLTSAGIFAYQADIGNPKIRGSVNYNPASKQYTLKGGGYNIWFNRDEFFYVYNRREDDFVLKADVRFPGSGSNPHRKIGWMIRASEAENAVHISATVHGDGLTVLQWRGNTGAAMRDPEDEIFYPEKNVRAIQLERQGDTFTMWAAGEGEQLKLVGSHTIKGFGKKVLAGLFICSHDPEVLEEGLVSNVQINRIR
ncbi:hypothetical protein [Flavihumibacter petaseus]|uniref:Uncharacterized protein n=1 Tax=Flavihumibacter petaseus NBRC 106054 TaxID=1220578 RepID=A0A0E9N6G0_9BACT|nr:hypothetical protein [Flavihumibacter petaseus]GAO45532.1 hypothetical protein FPE01S_06_00230 [Flavihumibacter petaseus NBRC 106054]